MAAIRRKLLALDANVLLDWADGNDAAHECREVFSSSGFGFSIPPTVIVELKLLTKFGDTEASALSRQALLDMTTWNCVPVTLSETEIEKAAEFRKRIGLLQLLPDDEWNDGLILAETALARVPLLVTSDRHLLNIDEDELIVALTQANLDPVHPVHPRRLARALR